MTTLEKLHLTEQNRKHETQKPLLGIRRKIRSLLIATLISLSTSSSGCVYHRKGHTQHPFLYDDNQRDALVLFPGQIDNPELEQRFDEQYELSLLASFTTWFAQIPEIGSIIQHFHRRFHHLPLAITPPILHVLLTNESHIDVAVQRAESIAEERKNEENK